MLITNHRIRGMDQVLPHADQLELANLGVTCEARINDCLSLLLDPRAERIVTPKMAGADGSPRNPHSLTPEEFIGLWKIYFFLRDSFDALRRMWRIMPEAFRITMDITGEPPVADNLIAAKKEEWKRRYMSGRYASSETGYQLSNAGATLGDKASPYVLRGLTDELTSWLAILYSYRSVLPYVTPSLAYLRSLEGLEPLLALPNFDTISIIDGRETGQYKLSAKKLFKGVDSMLVYFDINSKTRKILPGGPVSGSMSTCLFRTVESGRNKTTPRGQIAWMFSKYDRDLNRMFGALTDFTDALSGATPWTGQAIEATLQRIPIENVYILTAPELIQRWFSYVIKMGDADVAKIPCLTSYMSDVKIQDLENIANMFSKGSNKFYWDARWNADRKRAAHHNFANPIMIAQNAGIVEKQNYFLLNGTDISVGPDSDNDLHRAWEKSLRRNLALVRDVLVPKRKATIKLEDRKVQALMIHQARAILGFGLGFYGALYSSILIYGDVNKGNLGTILQNRAKNGDPIAQILSVWIGAAWATSSKMVEDEMRDVIALRGNRICVFPKSTDKQFFRDFDIYKTTQPTVETRTISSEQGRGEVGGIARLSSRALHDQFLASVAPETLSETVMRRSSIGLDEKRAALKTIETLSNL